MDGRAHAHHGSYETLWTGKGYLVKILSEWRIRIFVPCARSNEVMYSSFRQLYLVYKT